MLQVDSPSYLGFMYYIQIFMNLALAKDCFFDFKIMRWIDHNWKLVGHSNSIYHIPPLQVMKRGQAWLASHGGLDEDRLPNLFGGHERSVMNPFANRIVHSVYILQLVVKRV